MLTVGSLFSGIGLLDYGLHLAGLQHAWFCEADAWRRDILAQRWPGAAVLDDVRAVGAGAAERVDVIAGGFPCKGASTAGKRTGFGHPETVLWREMARAVGELRPRYVLVENVANILALHDGAVWGEVVGDLAALGYDVTWDCIPAAAVGAPHRRDRVFAVATYADGERESERARGDGGEATLGGAGVGAGGGVGVGNPAARVRGSERGAGADDGSAADAASARLEGPGLRGWPAQRDRPAAADADGRDSWASEQAGCERGGRPVSTRGDDAPPDADCGGLARLAPRDGASGALDVEHGHDADRRGVDVEWGEYGPAVRRWEDVIGRPAPEPLVRRVDDRGAARVERSRLSALGDGVQVQVGYLIGAHIMSMEGK